MKKNKNILFPSRINFATKENIEGMYISTDAKDTSNSVQHKPIMAGTFNGYLTWPGTMIPFIDRLQLAKHKNQKRIEMKIEAAIDNEALIDALWQDDEILAMTLRCE